MTDPCECTCGIGTSDISIFDFELDGNQVYLIDAPGFNDTERSDAETLRVLATYLSASYAQNVFIHGIVYLHRIADNRMTGSSKRNIDMFKALCGYSTYSNVAIATTFWNQPERQSFVRREAELRDNSDFFGDIVAEGARLFRHGEFGQDTLQVRNSAQSIVRHVVAQSRLPPVVLLIQHELVDEHKTLNQTTAGIVVAGELHEVAEENKRELAALEKKMEDMIRERDSNQKAAIADLQDEFQRKLGVAEREHKVFKSSMAELQKIEGQAVLDKLDATETRIRVQQAQREEKLKDMQESLRLMREEADRQGSGGRQKTKLELIEHENTVEDMRQNTENGQTAFNNLRGTTQSLRRKIVSAIAGGVTSAVLTGLTGGMLFNQQVAVSIALLITLPIQLSEAFCV